MSPDSRVRSCESRLPTRSDVRNKPFSDPFERHVIHSSSKSSSSRSGVCASVASSRKNATAANPIAS
jgi:hypothetical protein